MSHLDSKTNIALAMSLMMSLPVHAVDDLTVDGYVRSSSGEAVQSGSGDCLRTTYLDSQELLEECGYKRIVKEGVQVENQPVGAAVAVLQETTIVKDDVVLAAKQEVVAEQFIQNLQFEFNSADLTAADKGELDAVNAQIEAFRPLLRQNVAHMNVIGHTDSTGPEAYNQKLSERRAQAVAEYFAGEGLVPRETMRVSGKGEIEPIADNSTEAGRDQNRRVVIEIIKH
jgi:outer membrane protein OmpA-like peptidoglycan-associated protein